MLKGTRLFVPGDFKIVSPRSNCAANIFYPSNPNWDTTADTTALCHASCTRAGKSTFFHYFPNNVPHCACCDDGAELTAGGSYYTYTPTARDAVAMPGTSGDNSSVVVKWGSITGISEGLCKYAELYASSNLAWSYNPRTAETASQCDAKAVAGLAPGEWYLTTIVQSYVNVQPSAYRLRAVKLKIEDGETATTVKNEGAYLKTFADLAEATVVADLLRDGLLDVTSSLDAPLGQPRLISAISR